MAVRPPRKLSVHNKETKVQNKANSHPKTMKKNQRKQNGRRSPYSFLPTGWSRGAFLKWLRRTHAWLGLWGATLGILFGTTGILLNHRGTMKINAAKTERTKIELALPEVRPENVEDFAVWLQAELNIEKKWSRARSEPSQEISWDGQSVLQPEKWRVSFSNPQRTYSADYWVGNGYVSVTRFDRNVFAFLNRLHMASGMGVAWILLADSIAGSLIILSLTGILLWTRLHGPRLFAAGLGFGSLTLAIFFVWRAF